MNDYDQERFAEVCDELDAAREKIKCLEADLVDQRRCRWLIWSLEHHSWWRPERYGYTLSRDHAGRYSFDEAFEIVHGANAFTKGEPHEAMLPDAEWSFEKPKQ